MTIRIKLDLYVLQLCVKKNVGESSSKSSEIVVEMWKGLLTKIPN